MIRVSYLLLATLVALTGCGIRRPLIRPADVPAYESERAKRKAELEDTGGPSPFDAPEAAPAPAAPSAPQPNPLPPTQ